MAIARTATALVGSIASPGGSIPVPTSVANGSLILLFLNSAAIGVYTPPAGWTQLYSVQNTAGAGMTMACYYRFASSEPASYAWSWSTGQNACYVTCAYSGVSGTPINTSATASNGTTTTATAPAITTTVASTLIVATWAPRTSFTGAAPNCNAAFSNVAEVGGFAIAVGDLAASTAGSYGGWNAASATGVARSVSTSIALAPAPSSRPVPLHAAQRAAFA